MPVNFKNRINTAMVSRIGFNTTPVSYTHLDVKAAVETVKIVQKMKDSAAF